MIPPTHANPRNNAPSCYWESTADLVCRGGVILVDMGRLRLVPGNSGYRKPTKLLLNVNIERSLRPVQVVMSPERTVRDLIKSALEIYTKERRQPLLKDTNPKFFELHYSPFSLERLEREEKLVNLCSRNFFLCSNPNPVNNQDHTEEEGVSRSMPFPLTKLMDLLVLALGSCK